MDGLDRLVEMLEMRFGRFWADALLLCAVLGAAAWGIHAFVTYFLLPTIKLAVVAYGYVSGVHVPLPANINEIFTYATLPVIGLLCAISIYNLIISGRIGRSLKSADAKIKETFSEYDAIIKTLQEREVGYLKTIDDLKKQNAALAAVTPPTDGPDYPSLDK